MSDDCKDCAMRKEIIHNMRLEIERLHSENDSLRAENERLKAFEPRICQFTPTGVQIVAAKEFLKMLLWSFKEYLDEEKAENYLIIDMSLADEPEHKYTVELRRPNKPSSHDKRKEAEAEIARLRAEVERLTLKIQDYKEGFKQFLELLEVDV